jgi:Transposase and inactivated derivatives
LFGDVVSEKSQLNLAGQMVEKWCLELMNKFPFVKIDTHVVMPNHFHGIIAVGAALCGRPEKDEGRTNQEEGQPHNNNGQPHKNKGQPHRVAPTKLSLSDCVHRFKTITTKRYIDAVKNNSWQPINGKLWQRNFYDHIIRNENELNRIREYINNNPLQWDKDELNPFNKNQKNKIG